ncbi:MAG TPA: hypothetical protein VJ964_09250 [Balneolaceae bacterium]|nr:hypothetical protein [Balneolaceae bacterium]
MRFDRSSASLSNVMFNAEGDHNYHFEVGPEEAAIYYKPDAKTSGSYSLQATFTQLKKTGHPEAYGLFVGGKNLQKSGQEYLYFLIRQDGKYLIKRRTGSNIQVIVDWTSSDALKALGANEESTNKLEIACGHARVKFAANGKVIATISRSKLKDIEGITGLRINHHLHLNVNNFTLDPMNQDYRIFVF